MCPPSACTYYSIKASVDVNIDFVVAVSLLLRNEEETVAAVEKE